jgi:hypothetical protein
MTLMRNGRQIYWQSFFAGITTEESSAFMHKHPSIWQGGKSYKDIESTLQYFKANKYSTDEIINRPSCLLINPMAYENRFQVLTECLFNDVTLFFLARYVSLMNKEVMMLKAYNYVNQRGDVIANLKGQLDMPITIEKKLSEQMTLNED